MTIRLSSPLLGAAASLLAVALIVPAAPAAADPRHRPPEPVREFGNGPERNDVAAMPPQTAGARAAVPDPAAPVTGLRERGGYPRQTRLAEPAPDAADSSIKLGLVPYHGIAPLLNDLQRRSRRVSAEVVGRTHEGRDLYLVTVTEPESAGFAALQSRMRAQIESNPARAARDPLIRRLYKAPVFVNANIHGDEWEGTDAALRTITRLATATDPATGAFLRQSRLYFNITANPDGRVRGVRQNGAGFDLNRDFVTASQPEVRAMRQIMIDAQPLAMIDLHGYVNGTLIEPTTPPHGANYEYDLFIRHTYANGINMEAAVKALGHTPERDGVEPPQIPFRDSTEGWDDWPPIFTPQYAPFHGTVAAHTVEIPLRVNRGDYENLPVDELRRRSAINTDIAAAAIDATLGFAGRRRERLIADQIEVFRRGAAGEPSRPVPLGIVPGFGPEDVYNTTFPRAYVIPAGRGQHSAVAAARLADHLIDNDVRVERASRPLRLGGKAYPAGSYVVDMRQPKRGLANVMLEPGADISPRVNAMYDISGWSHGHLWGATVEAVTGGTAGEVRGLPAEPVTAAAGPAAGGSVPATGELSLRLGDAREVAALADLLGQGVEARWVGDGTAVLPASARGAAVRAADRYGVRFERAPEPASGQAPEPLRGLTVAAAAGADEVFGLREMGFTVRPVSTAVLNGGFDWAGVDVLFVSSGLRYGQLSPAARTALDGFLARGGVVARGATGSAFNTDAGLLTATPAAGREDANGTVSVTNAGGPVTGGERPYSFVYSPYWFTGLGPEVTVEQRFAARGPLIAGHWRADDSGAGGPSAAAGQPAVVRGLDERGAAVVMFGTEPLFRNHPKGLFGQVGRALYWSATAAGQAGAAARQTAAEAGQTAAVAGPHR